MNDDSISNVGKFNLLTDKQAAVLDLLANGRTTKEIANILDLSESAVNRRIELLRTRFGGITRLELARRYRTRPAEVSKQNASIILGVETDRQRLHVAPGDATEQEWPQDDMGSDLAFRDSLQISIEAPWSKPTEPDVVPRVLDGENAALHRGAAIAIILFAIVASLVLALAAALSITEALGK